MVILVIVPELPIFQILELLLQIGNQIILLVLLCRYLKLLLVKVRVIVSYLGSLLSGAKNTQNFLIELLPNRLGILSLSCLKVFSLLNLVLRESFFVFEHVVIVSLRTVDVLLLLRFLGFVRLLKVRILSLRLSFLFLLRDFVALGVSLNFLFVLLFFVLFALRLLLLGRVPRLFTRGSGQIFGVGVLNLTGTLQSGQRIICKRREF